MTKERHDIVLNFRPQLRKLVSASTEEQRRKDVGPQMMMLGRRQIERPRKRLNVPPTGTETRNDARDEHKGRAGRKRMLDISEPGVPLPLPSEKRSRRAHPYKRVTRKDNMLLGIRTEPEHHGIADPVQPIDMQQATNDLGTSLHASQTHPSTIPLGYEQMSQELLVGIHHPPYSIFSSFGASAEYKMNDPGASTWASSVLEEPRYPPREVFAGEFSSGASTYTSDFLAGSSKDNQLSKAAIPAAPSSPQTEEYRTNPASQARDAVYKPIERLPSDDGNTRANWHGYMMKTDPNIATRNFEMDEPFLSASYSTSAGSQYPRCEVPSGKLSSSTSTSTGDDEVDLSVLYNENRNGLTNIHQAHDELANSEYRVADCSPSGARGANAKPMSDGLSWTPFSQGPPGGTEQNHDWMHMPPLDVLRLQTRALNGHAMDHSASTPTRQQSNWAGGDWQHMMTTAAVHSSAISTLEAAPAQQYTRGYMSSPVGQSSTQPGQLVPEHSQANTFAPVFMHEYDTLNNEAQTTARNTGPSYGMIPGLAGFPIGIIGNDNNFTSGGMHCSSSDTAAAYDMQPPFDTAF